MKCLKNPFANQVLINILVLQVLLKMWSFHCGSTVMNLTCTHENVGSVSSLALLSGLRIPRFGELWCRSQMRLRSHVVVAVV